MKIYRSLFIIFVMIVIMAGATYAVWTDQAILGANNFATGTIKISTTPATALFNTTNMFPGWSETKSVAIKNDGTATMNYQLTTTKSGTSSVLFNSDLFLLKVGTTSGGSDLYTGPLKNATFTTPRSLNASATETLYLTPALDISAATDLETKTAIVNFVFMASS